MIKKDQIEKMANIIKAVKYEPFNDGKPTYTVGNQMQDFVFSLIAEELLKYYQPKLPEDSVVLSREEYNEIKMYQSYIPEMKKAFDKVRNATIKETTENIFDILYQWLDLENIEKYGFVTIQKFDFLRKFREIYKQFGVEIKE